MKKDSLKENLSALFSLQCLLLVLSLFASSFSVATGTVIAHYKFDLCDWEDTATATDSVGGFNGVVTGAVLRDSTTTSGLKPETCSSAEFGGGAIEINGLPVSTASGDKTSVSFWMYWDGSNSVMPLGWNIHDLWFYNGSFGFNSGGGDIYGIASAGLENGWHHVAAVFTNNNMLANELFIDGVSQVLTQRRGSPSNSRSVVNPRLRLGGWWVNNGYRFSGRLDEVKVYTGDIDQSQVDADIAYVNGACPNCPPPEPPPPAVLIAEYNFDDNWDSSGVLLDTVGGFDGVQTGNITRIATPAEDGKGDTCFAGQLAGGVFDINGLPLSTTSGDKTSVSFWMRWDGRNSMMPMGWGYHDLWFFNGNFGFNSAGGDIYGISSAGLEDEWHHVVAVFNNNRLTRSKLYIDGVEQTLTQRRGSPNNSRAVVDPHLRIGGWWANNGYRFRGALDEFKVYTGEMSDEQIQADMANTCFEPTGQWSMDEAGWTGAADEVIDSSGGGHHGTALGFNPDGPVTSYDDSAIVGNPGTCRYTEFDGIDDYIEIPDSSDLDNTEQLTLTAWFKADTFTQTNGTNARGLFSKRPSFSNNVSYGAFFWNGHGNRLYVDIDSTNNRFGSNTVFNADQWYHVAIVFDGTLAASERVKLYVDGALDGTFTESSTLIPDTLSNFFIGNLYTGTSTLKVFDGAIDEVRVIPRALNVSQVNAVKDEVRACDLPAIHHFDIDHNNSAIFCAPTTVTVTAEDISNSTEVNYSGTVTLDTNANDGDWSLLTGSGSFDNGTANDGIATYTYHANDNGVAVFSLDRSSAGPGGLPAINVSAVSGSVTDDDTEGALTFLPSGFTVTGAAIDDSTDPININLPIGTQTAGSDFSVHVAAYGQLPEDGSCGVIESYNGAKNIGFAINYDDPATGTIVPTFNGDPMTTVAPINFVQGQAEITARYKDVGNIGFVLTESALVGSSHLFVVKPARFDIQVPGNPAAADHNGAPFIAAGTAFDVSVIVRDSEGDITPNYGNEIAVESVTLTHNLVAPVGGQSGALSGTLTKTQPATYESNNYSWDEVGVISLVADVADDDYLGAGSVSNALQVGRFHPDHFDIENISLTNRTDANTQAGCVSDYSFLDEQMQARFDISARNAAGGITQNYTGDFAYINGAPSLGDDSGVVTDSVNLVGYLGGLTVTANSRLYGAVSTINMQGGRTDPDDRPLINFAMGRLAGLQPEVPFAGIGFGLNLIDQDSVGSNVATAVTMPGGLDQQFVILGATTLYFGRLVFENAYGSELQPLPMWAHSEYCNAVDATPACIQWQDLNRSGALVNDSCTRINVVAPAGTSIVDSWVLGGTYIPVANTTSSEILFQSFDVGQGRGGAGWHLSYDAGGAGGNFMLPDLGAATLENFHPYLLLQQGQASFGTYRGHDKIIYRREE